MKRILGILSVVLNPFFWVDLYRFLGEDEDDSLDLTDTPESPEYAEAQSEAATAWEDRQRKNWGGVR